MDPGSTAETDAFALAMIAVIFTAFGVVLLIVISILRNAAKRNREVEDLIEEAVEERKERPSKTPAAPVSQPWEKEGDWWKKD